MKDQNRKSRSNAEVAHCIRRLRDPSPRIRAGNAVVLGEDRVTEAVEDLLQTLDDQDVMVVGAAARALGQIGDRRAVPKLISTLSRLRNQTSIFAAARYSFGVTRGEIMYEPLPDQSVEPEDEASRRVRGIVGQFGRQADVEFQKLGAQVHNEVMTALVGFGDPSAIPPIVTFVSHGHDDPHAWLREDAARALTVLIDAMPNTEEALSALDGLHGQLLSAAQQRKHFGPYERDLEAAWTRSQAQVQRALSALRRRRRALCKALNKPTGGILANILSRLRQ